MSSLDQLSGLFLPHPTEGAPCATAANRSTILLFPDQKPPAFPVGGCKSRNGEEGIETVCYGLRAGLIVQVQVMLAGQAANLFPDS